MAMFAAASRTGQFARDGAGRVHDAVAWHISAGIEVILDIVLNHSAELGIWTVQPSPCAELITVAIG